MVDLSRGVTLDVMARALWTQLEQDAYALLGINADATDEQINAAWRVTAKRLHPDLGGSVTEFQQAELAYQVLSDPLTRMEYDRSRMRATTGAQPWGSATPTTAPGSTTGSSTRVQWVWMADGTAFTDPRDQGKPLWDDVDYRNAPPVINRKMSRWAWLAWIALGLFLLVAAVALAVVWIIGLIAVLVAVVGRAITAGSRHDHIPRV